MAKLGPVSYMYYQISTHKTNLYDIKVFFNSHSTSTRIRKERKRGREVLEAFPLHKAYNVHLLQMANKPRKRNKDDVHSVTNTHSLPGHNTKATH